MLKVMIVGQKWLAATLLGQCLADGHEVLAAVAPPAAGEQYDRLYAAAQQAGIAAITHAGRITAAHVPDGCDVILAAHAHVFIDASARCAARFGAIGYHPSLLPRHRGRDAVRWTIHMRDPIAGGTLYWIDDGADTGPIGLQGWCHVRPGDTAEGLWRRELAPLGLRLFREGLVMLEGGRLPARSQDEATATWEPGFPRRRLSEVP